jgi:protein SCO1/2
MLVFFGYTHCPDICPIDLLIMSQALDLPGGKAENVQPLFITIDPVRDTAPVLAEFVGHFHPSLIGLTGSAEQVAQAARVYRARYKKFFPLELGDEDEDTGGAGDGARGPEQGGQYLMDHTAATYLVGPDGGGLSLYPHGMTAADIAADIERFIDRQP